MDYLETVKELRLKAAAYNGPAFNPKSLPLDKIVSMPEVFQHRTCNGAASSAHRDVLTRSILRSPDKALAPVKVWQCADALICIDGHHRIEAYQAAEFKGKVPVTVYRGDLDQAIAESARGNTKDKLPMQRHEKYNAAWRMTLATKLSLAKVADSAGCSDRLVTAMRQARGKLLRKPELLHGNTIDSLTWSAARNLAAGGEPVEYDGDTGYVELEAEKLKVRLVKGFGAAYRESPEVWARALELFNGQLPKQLSEIWGQDFGDDFDPVLPTGDF